MLIPAAPGAAVCEFVAPAGFSAASFVDRGGLPRLFGALAVLGVVRLNGDISPGPPPGKSWGRGPDVKGARHAVSSSGEANPLHWASPMIFGTKAGRIFGVVAVEAGAGTCGDLAAACLCYAAMVVLFVKREERRDVMSEIEAPIVTQETENSTYWPSCGAPNRASH